MVYHLEYTPVTFTKTHVAPTTYKESRLVLCNFSKLISPRHIWLKGRPSFDGTWGTCNLGREPSLSKVYKSSYKSKHLFQMKKKSHDECWNLKNTGPFLWNLLMELSRDFSKNRKPFKLQSSLHVPPKAFTTSSNPQNSSGTDSSKERTQRLTSLTFQ